MPKVLIKKVSWDEVEAWVAAVSNKIYASGWQPDVILALSRGGYVPARLVCDRLVVGDLISLQLSHWPSAAQMSAKGVIVKYPIECDLNHKKVLIMDDISDTGDSIIVAKDFIWTKCRPDEIRVATLQWISGSSKIKPDFYADEVKKWCWYQYPWTRLEDVIGFVKRIMIETKEMREWTLEGLSLAFNDWFGVTYEKWFYERALEFLLKNDALTKGKKGYLLKQ